MSTRHAWSLILLLLSLYAGVAAAYAQVVQATQPQHEALGRSASYFLEKDAPLTLAQVVDTFEAGQFLRGDSRILNFGIGSRPVWIHLGIVNSGSRPLGRRLSIETAWLDRIDVYVRHGGALVHAEEAGDALPHGQRPVDGRYFVFPVEIKPGQSDVFIRVETPDPMVVPIHLLSAEEGLAREAGQNYSYGFLYGFLFALLVYNATLDVGLRNSRYILYSLYLGMFILMNVSYTGHGHQWLWPENAAWTQWSNPILIMLYGISGLAFALRFLDIRRYFPRLQKAVLGYVGLFATLLALAMLFDRRDLALLVSFTFVFLFTWGMLGLGALSLRSGQRPAKYFLLAAIAGMVGAGTTALSVWGFIPHNVWTFRAVEMGMLFDATMLALALVYHFRVGHAERLRAEKLAQLDPLTGLDNRRAFYDKASAIWNMTLRHERSLSVVLLDIDHFKRINDTHGHAQGDEVLLETARLLVKSIRQEDVAARWGGEEFLLLLPETGLKEAVALAERLRQEMAEICLRHSGGEITFTASFGVAERDTRHATLDLLISSADKYLYRAKNLGRNQVSFQLAVNPA